MSYWARKECLETGVAKVKERKGKLLEVSVLCTFKKVKKVATLPPEEPLRSEGQHDILEVWGELEPAQKSVWYFKHNAQPTVWWLICHSEWSTMNAFINRNSLILGAFMSDHWYSHRFHSLMSNLKTLGSLMMFPGTMTRPPPPFTSTITRLSSRSLSCQVVRCKWYFCFKPVDIVWFADPTSVPCFRDEVVVKNFLEKS